jgi:16S rRNA (adenine1518-N6/adenine1519-N6)-dimethyltransferase
MDRTTGRPKRSLGQHFLADERVAARIVAALEIGAEDLVLEIGPGRGALTGLLAAAGPARLCAVEKDDALAAALAAELALRYPGIEVSAGDALEYPWQTLPAGAKIVGNLPYNVSARLVWAVASRAAAFKRAVFMVQHEMALRLLAPPGHGAYGWLAVLVQNVARVRRLFTVRPGAFRPRPKVDSAVVELVPLADRPADPAPLERLARACFARRRKQLRSILGPAWSVRLGEWLAGQGLAPNARPEELDPRRFLDLTHWLPADFFDPNREFPY